MVVGEKLGEKVMNFESYGLSYWWNDYTDFCLFIIVGVKEQEPRS